MYFYFHDYKPITITFISKLTMYHYNDWQSSIQSLSPVYLEETTRTSFYSCSTCVLFNRFMCSSLCARTRIVTSDCPLNFCVKVHLCAFVFQLTKPSWKADIYSSVSFGINFQTLNQFDVNFFLNKTLKTLYKCSNRGKSNVIQLSSWPRGHGVLHFSCPQRSMLLFLRV